MKHLITTALVALALSGCATTSGYNVKVNGVDTQAQKKKGLSNTEIGLFILGAGAIAYMGFSTGNSNKTPQETIDRRDACRAAAQNETEWQQC